MYKYYNAHPKGFWINDSDKRAVALTTRLDYAEVEKMMNEYKSRSIDEETALSDSTFSFVEEVLGAKKMNFSKLSPIKMTAERFCKTHRRGRYILEMEGHRSACINGILLDTWDPSDEIVLAAYKITPLRPEQTVKLRLCYTVHDFSEYEMGIVIYDGNGRSLSKTLSREDAGEYIKTLKKRGYPDMTNISDWM